MIDMLRSALFALSPRIEENGLRLHYYANPEDELCPTLMASRLYMLAKIKPPSPETQHPRLLSVVLVAEEESKKRLRKSRGEGGQFC